LSDRFTLAERGKIALACVPAWFCGVLAGTVLVAIAWEFEGSFRRGSSVVLVLPALYVHFPMLMFASAIALSLPAFMLRHSALVFLLSAGVFPLFAVIGNIGWQAKLLWVAAGALGATTAVWVFKRFSRSLSERHMA